MMGLADVTSVSIPRQLFTQSHLMLREIGRDKVEGLVLWAGSQTEREFTVRAVIQPAQRCIRAEHGLLVLVDGPELHRVGVWLYTRELQLLAQVHSHPTDAYHSETDDTIPIVTTQGGLSLVVPDFARGDADLSTYAGYRLGDDGRFYELASASLSALIHVEGFPDPVSG